MVNIKIYKNNFYQLFKDNRNKRKLFIVVLNNGMVFNTTSSYLSLTKYSLETNTCLISEKSPFTNISHLSRKSNNEGDIYHILLNDIKYIIECNDQNWIHLLQDSLYKNFNLSFVKSEEELSSLSEVYFIYSDDKFMSMSKDHSYNLLRYKPSSFTTIPTKEEVYKLKEVVTYLNKALTKCQVFKTMEEGDEYLCYLDFLNTVDLDTYLEKSIIRIEKESEDYLRREYRREAIAIAERQKEKGL